MKEEDNVVASVISIVAIGIMLGAVVLLPILAVAAIPLFAVIAGYFAWSENPSRLEKISKKHTWELYEEAKKRVVSSESADDIFDKNVGEIPLDKQKAYRELKSIFMGLWRYEGYDMVLPEPPPMCNSIDGGRYRDFLNRVDDNLPALLYSVTMTKVALEHAKMDRILALLIINEMGKEYNDKMLFPKTLRQMNANYERNPDYIEAFSGTVLQNLNNYKIPLSILPYDLRTHHHHILASSGSGKTQCLQQMILKDLEEDASIVVIDSQNQMINKLATRIDPKRLILIDPQHCPPALNLFANEDDEEKIATAIEFYQYIFASLDAEMTSKQQVPYQFVCRLLMKIPNATLYTMLELMQPKETLKHQKYIDEMGEVAKAFFKNELDSSQYNDTKKEIARRLYGILVNETLAKMLGATESRLNIEQALDSGKVILISTSKKYLKKNAASLLGRIFIAQVMQAIMARGDKGGKRTYLYIDEFDDYAEGSHVFLDLFAQARKYNLGIIIAHQLLGRIPTQLLQSIFTNTAIKFVRGVSNEDTVVMAKQMKITPDFINNQPVGDFACYLRDIGVFSYPVDFGKLENMPEISKISAIHEDMRKRYGVPFPTEVSPKKPYSEPPEGKGSGEVVEEEIEERSKW